MAGVQGVEVAGVLSLDPPCRMQEQPSKACDHKATAASRAPELQLHIRGFDLEPHRRAVTTLADSSKSLCDKRDISSCCTKDAECTQACHILDSQGWACSGQLGASQSGS